MAINHMNTEIEKYNAYHLPKKLYGGSEAYQIYISTVFDNHYFSNHWELAKRLESELIGITKIKNCVTYMNSSIALISSLHILGVKAGGSINVGRGVILFDWVMSCIKYLDLNICREFNNESNIVSIVLDIDAPCNKCDSQYISIPTRVCVENNINNNCISIYNMDRETCFNMDTGAFIAVNDDAFAHKLRHMRSSYGRTGDVAVEINGNGRFSEIQAAEALTSLGTNFQNVLSHNFIKAVSFASKFKYKSNIIGEKYTSPILIIKCPDHNAVEKIQIKLGLFDCENENVNYEIDKSDILIRAPLKPSLNDDLFSCLLSC